MAAGGEAAASAIREALADSILTDPGFWALGPRPSPLDLAVELARAMDAGRFVKGKATYTQTVYVVLLSSEDGARFADRSRELVATLKDALVWWARRSGYTVPGEIRVVLQSADELPPGRVSIEAGLREDEARALGRRRTYSE